MSGLGDEEFRAALETLTQGGELEEQRKAAEALGAHAWSKKHGQAMRLGGHAGNLLVVLEDAAGTEVQLAAHVCSIIQRVADRSDGGLGAQGAGRCAKRCVYGPPRHNRQPAGFLHAWPPCAAG